MCCGPRAGLFCVCMRVGAAQLAGCCVLPRLFMALPVGWCRGPEVLLRCRGAAAAAAEGKSPPPPSSPMDRPPSAGRDATLQGRDMLSLFRPTSIYRMDIRILGRERFRSLKSELVRGTSSGLRLGRQRGYGLPTALAREGSSAYCVCRAKSLASLLIGQQNRDGETLMLRQPCGRGDPSSRRSPVQTHILDALGGPVGSLSAVAYIYIYICIYI